MATTFTFHQWHMLCIVSFVDEQQQEGEERKKIR